MKKNFSYVGALIILVVLFIAVSTFSKGAHSPVHAQTSDCANGGACLSGWAWSSNIGWVSFNSNNSGSGGGSYEVDIDNSGNLSGHAWSPNIGWISFNGSETNVPPANDTGLGVSSIANVSTTTGRVIGWGRALAGCRGDNWNGIACTKTGAGDDNGTSVVSGVVSNTGWDGWIHLSGTNNPTGDLTGNGGVTYSTATGKFLGYAWGSDVVGWLQFTPSPTVKTICDGDGCPNVQRLTGRCTTSPASSATPTDVTFTATPDGTTGPYYYNGSSVPVNGPYIKTLHESASTILDVQVADSGTGQGIIECTFSYTGGIPAQSCTFPNHAVKCDTTASSTPNPSGPNGVNSCSAIPYGYCAFSCAPPYHLNTAKTLCVSSSVIEI